MKDLIVDTFSSSDKTSIILVHGGAWGIPDDECKDHEKGIHEAILIGENALSQGKSAVDVVVDVLTTMENSGIFDAGCGAVLNQAGEVELDAGIMDGRTKQWGAVCGIKHFKNPTRIAYDIAIKGNGQYCFLPNTYAEDFAREMGYKPSSNQTLISPRERARYERLRFQADSYHTSHPFLKQMGKGPTGTIGCVVLDADGSLASGTSTGGTPFRKAGRIGDSPLPGCGFFANSVGAASATGWGEAIAGVALCRTAVSYLEQGLHPAEAVSVSLKAMYTNVQNSDGQGATGGLILMEAGGNGAWGFTTPRMARGWSHMQNGAGQRFIKVT